MKDRKNKHLTLEDRNTIQQCLDHGMTFKAIAAQIGKDQTTVSKEVKKHLEFTASRVVYRDKNGAFIADARLSQASENPLRLQPL